VPDPVIGLQVVDLDALKELAWSGVPSDLRPTCWQLLLGYLPPNRERRCDTAGGPAFSLACPSVSVSALTFPGMAKVSNSTRPFAFYNLARASRLGRRVVSRCHMTGSMLPWQKHTHGLRIKRTQMWSVSAGKQIPDR